VSTLHDAAKLLTACTTLRATEAVARALGFGEALPVGAALRDELGLPDGIGRARVASSAGLLRMMLVSAPPEAIPRQVAAQSAVRLGERSPHLLWVVAVVQPATRTLVLAVPPVRGGQRVSALVVDTHRVQDSDAETIAAMSDACGSSEMLTHHRWRELLGRDSLTRRFYRELESVVVQLGDRADGNAPVGARREIALLCTSRLLFLAFLEAKGWLDGDREFLRHRFDERCMAGGRVHRALLDPLFFGTLNTPVSRRAAVARALGRVPFLNGGLFARSPVERRYRSLTLADDAIGSVICGLLGRYRVTACEESVSWSETAIDPEMLGRAFESLMATDDRRRSGAFYTPLAILERVTAEGLDEWLASVGIASATRTAIRANEPFDPAERARVLRAVSDARILDPACGSGAFLVHALERLADIRLAAGDTRATDVRRRDVLTRSIFGVDVNPTAVWLCELRLWLSMVIDTEIRDGLEVTPLPNLDHHVRVGDALAGAAFDEPVTSGHDSSISLLRDRYTRATGTRKRTLSRALDRAERRIAIRELDSECTSLATQRRDLVVAMRGRDLFGERTVPASAQRAALTLLRASARDARRRHGAVRDGAALSFSFRSQFADVGARGGFDVVLGNPPWVRANRLSPAQRSDFGRRYRAWREAAWTDGAADTGAGRGFASQVDLSALFVERASQLVRPGGAISLLVPAKLWSALSAGGVRRVLRDTCHVAALEDWSESRAAFDAVVYPSMLVARRGKPSEPRLTEAAVHRRDRILAWEQEPAATPLDASPGAPWLLMPREVRASFDLLTARGTRLAHSPLGRPMLGVKTGCNDAFIVTPNAGWRETRDATDEPWIVRAGEREGFIERDLLRPVIRGEDVAPWAVARSAQALVWTHGLDDVAVPQLPAHAARWLAPWRRQLQARTDAARTTRWWTIFRTESARPGNPRVVWSDISKVPRATVLEPGDPTVAINTCYVASLPTLDDAFAFAALLNSAPAAAWLCGLAEPARGGYRRFLGWTLARFPIPSDWTSAVRILAPIGRAARDGVVPDAHTLALAVARAYGLRLSRLEPLMTWCLR